MGHIVAAIYVTLGFLLFSFAYFDGFYLTWFDELGISIIVFGIALHLVIFIREDEKKRTYNQNPEQEVEDDEEF
ncbi:hypothetical protein IQ283_04425 [Alkalihalobacillus hwajinpoensis]|uniref:hypothetical protein n=1 Tax=Guptibacillus hwajinpoensis TaxID=208199 RepID=UPI0018845753|nr:hypothetical protein [Pseudalkalibacillus hwajinpoensis]MBF0705843.1 hypothetical protein [Pseudalkalibacillus hwajinpoensis]